MRLLAALILAAAALALPSRAPATILFASGEDSGFNAIGAVIAWSSAGTRFRAGYARGVIATSTNTGAVDPPANRMQTATFTAGSVLWIHAQIYDQLNTTTLNQQGIIVRSPDGQSRIVVRQTGTYGSFKVSTRNAAGTITDLATASAAYVLNSITQLDLKIDYSAGGGVQMWLGGTQVINYSGDPRTDAATQLNQVEFANLPGLTNWSEIIIADQDTRAMGLVTLAANLAGNTQGWTGGTQTAVNEAPLNDASFLSDSTGNVLSQWNPGGSLPGSPQILTFIQEARVRKGGTGPSAFDWSVRTNGADYLAGTTTALTTSFVNYTNQQWPTNPATGTGWLPADLPGGGFNFGIKSLP